MSRLSLKTLTRKRLPYGRFNFVVLLTREARHYIHADSNAGAVESMRDMLRTTCVGQYRLDHKLNWNKRRVYTHLYLTNPMDLAMIKLVHSEKLHKIYKIRLAEQP